MPAAPGKGCNALPLRLSCQPATRRRKIIPPINLMAYYGKSIILLSSDIGGRRLVQPGCDAAGSAAGKETSQPFGQASAGSKQKRNLWSRH